jgi:hypothetical protein
MGLQIVWSELQSPNQHVITRCYTGFQNANRGDIGCIDTGFALVTIYTVGVGLQVSDPLASWSQFGLSSHIKRAGSSELSMTHPSQNVGSSSAWSNSSWLMTQLFSSFKLTVQINSSNKSNQQFKTTQFNTLQNFSNIPDILMYIITLKSNVSTRPQSTINKPKIKKFKTINTR